MKYAYLIDSPKGPCTQRPELFQLCLFQDSHLSLVWRRAARRQRLHQLHRGNTAQIKHNISLNCAEKRKKTQANCDPVTASAHLLFLQVPPHGLLPLQFLLSLQIKDQQTQQDEEEQDSTDCSSDGCCRAKQRRDV